MRAVSYCHNQCVWMCSDDTFTYRYTWLFFIIILFFFRVFFYVFFLDRVLNLKVQYIYIVINNVFLQLANDQEMASVCYIIEKRCH